MSTRGYKPLAQGPEAEPLPTTEQNKQPHKDECTTFPTEPNDGLDEQTGPDTERRTTMLSFEIDLGESLVVDEPIGPIGCHFAGKKQLLIFASVILFAMSMLFLTVTKPNAQEMAYRRRHKRLAALVQSRLPTISFNSRMSPERQALDWMAGADEFQRESISDDRLVQRFAMAAIAFALGITGDEEWMAVQSECLWSNGQFVVQCNVRDSSVEEIWPGTNLPNRQLPTAVGLLTNLKVLHD